VAEDAIPPNLAGAFSEAVLAFNDWKENPSNPEREVPIVDRGFHTMSAVCGFVDKYTDQLPAHVSSALRSYLHDMPSGDLKEKLELDRTYATGAYCLRALIERRKERHSAAEELRRNR
jgi:hypothetical protein